MVTQQDVAQAILDALQPKMGGTPGLFTGVEIRKMLSEREGYRVSVNRMRDGLRALVEGGMMDDTEKKYIRALGGKVQPVTAYRLLVREQDIRI